MALAEGTGGTTAFKFTVTLSPASTVPATVTFATVDGTATAGSDFAAASGTLTFDPGVTDPDGDGQRDGRRHRLKPTSSSRCN